MLTVKTVKKLFGELFGTEAIFEAKRTWTSKEIDQDYSFHHADAEGNLGTPLSLNDYNIYVMNDKGKTIANY